MISIDWPPYECKSTTKIVDRRENLCKFSQAGFFVWVCVCVLVVVVDISLSNRITYKSVLALVLDANTLCVRKQVNRRKNGSSKHGAKKKHVQNILDRNHRESTTHQNGVNTSRAELKSCTHEKWWQKKKEQQKCCCTHWTHWIYATIGWQKQHAAIWMSRWKRDL